KDAPLEVQRRIDLCIKKIATGPGPDLPAAAARLLAIRRPAGAVEALLDYLPLAEDEWARDELLASVGALAVSRGRAELALTAGLRATAPGRRATAALILAQRGGLALRDAVRRLLA